MRVVSAEQPFCIFPCSSRHRSFRGVAFCDKRTPSYIFAYLCVFQLVCRFPVVLATVFPPSLIRPSIGGIYQRPLPVWHLRRVPPVAGIARETRNSGAATVARFRCIACAIPRLIRVVLTYPSSALADIALRLHKLILSCPPRVSGSFNADASRRFPRQFHSFAVIRAAQSIGDPLLRDLPQIGLNEFKGRTFTKTESGYSGKFETLAIKANVTLVRNDDKESTSIPITSSTRDGKEIGVAWGR